MKQSVFVQQQGVECDFTGSTPWVILSPIEQSIKQKIEAVGTPLKDWDINIYRGVLTGYNDAFIIDTEKREAILANCQTEEERKRTAELIRPILRGRDIRRYEYEWADKYLIATFPSRHYDIELYPAVKRHLLSFGKERLEQTGKTYSINGEKIKARKKTHNKWFETQDSISYWDENLQQLFDALQKNKFRYRERFLLPYRDGYKTVRVSDINHIETENKTVYLRLNNGTSEVVNVSMDELEHQLNPDYFFRANRQYIINVEHVLFLGNYFGGKLIVRLKGYPKTEIQVSKEKAQRLKEWIDR